MFVEIAPGIVVDPSIRFGKPVIKDTRVPVELVIGKLAGGMSPQEVAGEYEITVEDCTQHCDMPLACWPRKKCVVWRRCGSSLSMLIVLRS
jgi:uncharacterized protein (DUF433 family)